MAFHQEIENKIFITFLFCYFECHKSNFFGQFRRHSQEKKKSLNEVNLLLARSNWFKPVFAIISFHSLLHGNR